MVGLGTTEIWDGADLVLLRETITKLFQNQACKWVGFDMQHVLYVPSGFFGMLCDWHDRGVHIHVLSPTPRVQRMLWFSTFFRRHENEAGCHELSLDSTLTLGDDSSDVFERMVSAAWAGQSG